MKKILSFFVVVALIFSSCTKTSTDPTTLPDTYSNNIVGYSAHDVLSSERYTSLTIEIQYMPGYQLQPNALVSLKSYINTFCNKPAGINIIQTQIAGNGDTLTQQQVSKIEKNNRTAYTSGNNLAIYVLVTDGYNTTNTTLGFAYRNTSICLFGKILADNSGGVTQVSPTTLQATVLEHELGHIMGLVDLGSPMQVNHLDTTNGKHCNNKSCLMYYATETQGVLPLLASKPVPALDANCKNDLHANGGK